MRFALAAMALAAAGCQIEYLPPPYVAPPAYPAVITAANFPAYDGAYRVPVIGRWRVTRTHYELVNDQAFAMDMVVDKPHPAQRPGHKLSEYPSYGLPIVADGPGVIATAVDGVPENDVPSMNPYEAHGNYVVIDHRNGEFSLFAHLIPGTVRVKVGDVVAIGQELGKCGNSGNTTMPHLHYQVMDHYLPILAHARAIRHLPYLKNGKLTTDRLERGDVFEATP
jgi:murein DD-endopeptidase MepM/ murein hydrolase activator NlpD